MSEALSAELGQVTAEQIGRAVRLLRKRAGRSQNDVGLALGADKGRISRWESGKVEIKSSTLLSYLQELGSNLGELQLALDGELGEPGDDSEVVTLPEDNAWLRQEDERVDRELERDTIRDAAADKMEQLGFPEMARQIRDLNDEMQEKE